MSNIIKENEVNQTKMSDLQLKLASLPNHDVKNRAALQSELAALSSTQARIDSAMLEECPDKMGIEQLKNWEKSQVVV